jgi:hypothetical protein
MCLDCGCGKPNESHGDQRHITLDTVRSAAEASGISETAAMDNIAAGIQQVRASQGSASEASGRGASAD